MLDGVAESGTHNPKKCELSSCCVISSDPHQPDTSFVVIDGGQRLRKLRQASVKFLVLLPRRVEMSRASKRLGPYLSQRGTADDECDRGECIGKRPVAVQTLLGAPVQ